MAPADSVIGYIYYYKPGRSAKDTRARTRCAPSPTRARTCSARRRSLPRTRAAADRAGQRLSGHVAGTTWGRGSRAAAQSRAGPHEPLAKRLDPAAVAALLERLERRGARSALRLQAPARWPKRERDPRRLLRVRPRVGARPRPRRSRAPTSRGSRWTSRSERAHGSRHPARRTKLEQLLGARSSSWPKSGAPTRMRFGTPAGHGAVRERASWWRHSLIERRRRRR